MIKYIKAFFLFLVPILRKTAIMVAADEANRLLRNERMRRPMPAYQPSRVAYTHYDRFRTPRTMQEVDRLEEERLARRAGLVDIDEPKTGDFHDVLMVAFDVFGPTEALVHEWLARNMPATGVTRDGIYIDDAWIADDGDRDDRDSAVFVTKGNQIKARALLREHGLVE